MIRVIAVDDEQPALKRVQKLLQAMDGVQIDGVFDSSRQALEYATTSTEPIDLALLDMEMPGLNGLELAERLREVRPEIQIAFLTAYDEYARDAFDVEAIDYLLKPIISNDLVRTIKRAQKRSQHPEIAKADSEPRIAVHSFGPFSVFTEQGEAVWFRNSKSRELLAYLHYHSERSVSKSQIMNDLWQGHDVERTQVNLHSTVYQLRKDLEACGLHGIVDHSKTAGGSYSVHWSTDVDDDVAAYEKAYQLYRSDHSLTYVLRAIQVYGDGFLAGSGYAWAAPRQAELELTYTELLGTMVDVYVRQNRCELALGPMQKLAQLQPLDERIQARMIALLLLLKRDKDAHRQYRKVQESLGRGEQLILLEFSHITANPASFF